MASYIWDYATQRRVIHIPSPICPTCHGKKSPYRVVCWNCWRVSPRPYMRGRKHRPETIEKIRQSMRAFIQKQAH
jgi:hypothetical protein